MQAAIEVFTSTGYHNSAMDDIAARAGISKPILYQHFSGKRELYLGLLDNSCDEILASIKTAMDLQTDAKSRLAAAVAYYFDAVDRTDLGFRLIFESDFTADSDVKVKVGEFLDRLSCNVAADIETATGLPREDAHMLATGLSHLGQTMAFRWVRRGRTISKERAVELTVALAWRGISGFLND